MIKYTDEGIVTDEAQVAVMFLGKRIEVEGVAGDFLPVKSAEWYIVADGFMWNTPPKGFCDVTHRILIPYPLVKEAYQPIEGEGYVYDASDLKEGSAMEVFSRFDPDPRRHGMDKTRMFYHKRVLNIITTRGELWELIERVEGV